MPKNIKNPKTGRKKLTPEQEFDIMKLVFDKFLWVGFGLTALGLYKIFQDILEGLVWLISGIVVLLLFTWIIVREYEIVAK